MNEQEKKSYTERYKEAKARGVPFFPDIIFKDTIAVLVVFIVLVALAYFVGAPIEARADPTDKLHPTPRVVLSLSLPNVEVFSRQPGSHRGHGASQPVHFAPDPPAVY